MKMKLLNKQDLDKLVGEPFEKFLSRLDLKCPDPIEAIPIEWINKWVNNYCDSYQENLIKCLLRTWRKENADV